MREFFVSYSFCFSGGDYGFGNVPISVDGPITKGTIRGMEVTIRQHLKMDEKDQLVIISYQELES